MSQSQTPPHDPTNRSDQIVHRFYLKTVGVLVDGRLTHHGVGDIGGLVDAGGGGGGESRRKGKSREGSGMKEIRIDKWVSSIEIQSFFCLFYYDCTKEKPTTDHETAYDSPTPRSSISLSQTLIYSDPISQSTNPFQPHTQPDHLPHPPHHSLLLSEFHLY
jgi:hypothetical protein